MCIYYGILILNFPEIAKLLIEFTKEYAKICMDYGMLSYF